MRAEFVRTLVVCALAGLCVNGCGAELPSEVHVDVLELHAQAVTVADLQSAFAGADLTPPLYAQAPGTSLYAIVVPFDIPWLPEGVSFQLVRVTVYSWREVGNGTYDVNPDVRLVTPIPLSVERSTDKTNSTKLAASFKATIEALSGTLGAESSSSESYEKIYRSVTAHLTPANEATWEFEPFLDEAIPGGLHYVVLVVEVPNGSTGNLFYADAGCYYTADPVMGVTSERQGCYAGAHQWLELP